MDEELVDPELCNRVSTELAREDLMHPLVELEPTADFVRRGMFNAQLLHSALNGILCTITQDYDTDHLPLFSVRKFEPGVHSTTIHRNHPTIGPWAIGITLAGTAPFNVYEQHQLGRNEILPLAGDGTDPTPLETMDAHPGAGWTLYTEHELVPHSGGIVDSQEPRELLIMYNSAYSDYTF